jgi:hypothetical protein
VQNKTRGVTVTVATEYCVYALFFVTAHDTRNEGMMLKYSFLFLMFQNIQKSGKPIPIKDVTGYSYVKLSVEFLERLFTSFVVIQITSTECINVSKYKYAQNIPF